MRALPLVALACALAVVTAPAQRKKKKEEQTQVLQVPRDLPSAVTGDARHFTFHVTPLSARGLLSQQVRDALRALARDNGGDTVLRLRAFVAGSGDLRRVRDIASDVFTDRKQPLPVLSLVQAGGLPMEGAQVVLESISVSRKEVNPQGLAFLSAQPAVSDNPLDPVAPLAAKSLAALAKEVKAAGSESADVLRVTCFLSSLDNLAATRRLVEAEYPRAALDYVQTQRVPGQAVAACEAVARLHSAPAGGLAFLDSGAGLSQAALVSAPQVVLTGTQVSFGYQDADARLAFERMARILEQAGTSPRAAAYVSYYPLSMGIAAQVRKLRGGFFDAPQPPAGSILQFEGLPSMDAGFALDVLAIKQ